MDIDKKKLQDYLQIKFNKPISDLSIVKLGSGVVGSGYKVEFNLDGNKMVKILKELFKEEMNLDYPSDRARNLLLAHSNFNQMKNHVNSVDVLGVKSNSDIVSLDGTQEFFLLMDEAKGRDMFKDFEEISKQDYLTNKQRNKIIMLSDFLVDLHKNKKSLPSLYKRKIRDTIASECLMGVLDMYPENLDWINDEEITNIVKLSVDFWRKTKRMHHRLCEIHGDFHPGNLWFDGDKLTILDRTRGTYGEPADDIAAFIINPIFYGLAKNGKFDGALKETFELFCDNYFLKTKDSQMFKVIQPYLIFRIAVVCNPLFYNDDFFNGNPSEIRKKLFGFAFKLLNREEFNYKGIDYILN
ncbi:phosphotransferase [Candidatus Woesearchaeota archaeon]|nr:phosphotransferase [Candidatus Woesearchaeota archaeon]